MHIRIPADQVGQGEDGSSAGADKRTLWCKDVNENVTMDLPLHADLSYTKTCSVITAYQKEKADQTEKNECSEDSKDAEASNKIRRPITALKNLNQPYCLGSADGKPVISWRKMMQPFHFMHVAGFHTASNAINGWGYLFKDTVLRPILKFGNRGSEGKLGWYCESNDPTQTIAEQPVYDVSFRENAIRGLMAMGESLETITCKQVHDHMMNRSKEAPVAFLIWQCLTIWEVIAAVLDTEKPETEGAELPHGNFRKYLRLMRVLKGIAAVSGSNHYCNLLRSEIWRWMCACEAEIKIWESYGFTKVTPNSKTIWVDRFVEWTIKEIRVHTGRTWDKGKGAEITRTVFHLHDIAKSRQQTRSLLEKVRSRGSSSDVVEVEMLPIYKPISQAVDKLNVFGKLGSGIGTLQGDSIWWHDDPGVVLGLDNAELNPEMLDLLDTMSERDGEIDRQYAERGTFNATLASAVATTAKDVDMARQRAWDKLYSHDKDTIFSSKVSRTPVVDMDDMEFELRRWRDAGAPTLEGISNKTITGWNRYFRSLKLGEAREWAKAQKKLVPSPAERPAPLPSKAVKRQKMESFEQKNSRLMQSYIDGNDKRFRHPLLQWHGDR